MKWYLILTIFGYWDTGSAMHQIGPFGNEAECQSAAKVWLVRAEKSRSEAVARYSFAAACVQSSAK